MVAEAVKVFLGLKTTVFVVFILGLENLLVVLLRLNFDVFVAILKKWRNRQRTLLHLILLLPLLLLHLILILQHIISSYNSRPNHHRSLIFLTCSLLPIFLIRLGLHIYIRHISILILSISILMIVFLHMLGYLIF